MTYWTWSGHDDDLPTLHVFEYGLLNIWEDGLTIEKHWMDADPPNLKPEVLADIKEWGGVWDGPNIQVQFPDGNDHGALMWKLKYPSKSGCTSPDRSTYTDANGVRWIKSQGSGLGEKI